MDFDVDDLLCEDSRVPVTIAQDVRSLEYILGLGEDEELPEDVELPFWLAKSLQHLSVAEPTLPKQYGPRMQGRLKAQAWSVRLREHSLYYYELGLKLSRLALSTGASIGDCGVPEFRAVLRKALAARTGEVIREALNSRGDDVSEFLDGACRRQCVRVSVRSSVFTCARCRNVRALSHACNSTSGRKY